MFGGSMWVNGIITAVNNKRDGGRLLISYWHGKFGWQQLCWKWFEKWCKKQWPGAQRKLMRVCEHVWVFAWARTVQFEIRTGATNITPVESGWAWTLGPLFLFCHITTSWRPLGGQSSFHSIPFVACFKPPEFCVVTLCPEESCCFVFSR